jgi:predicted O-linked N-acetylglucosamine transferase (SPINDLY family)
MDCRLTDPHLDPPGQTDRHYSERSIWLDTYWCYQPEIDSLEVTAPPASSSGAVTFGCLNDFAKVTPAALTLWSRLLAALPSARLVLHAPPGSHRSRTGDVLARAGIDPQRLTFVPRVPLPEYLAQYHDIDIALDPFPYGGGATSCDALWMGVPLISLSGRTAVGRAGASILSNVGLTEWIAKSPDDYVRIALEWSADPARLASVRRDLRERMRRSALMDAPRFARNVESAYRQMWRTWCAAGL